MRRISTGIFLPAGVLLVASFLSPRFIYPAFDPSGNPHAHFLQPVQCPRCHLYAGSKPDPGRFAASSVDFCLECHLLEERGRTHPFNVRPGERVREMRIPGDYRLSDDGRIVCLTCHASHDPRRPFLSPARAFSTQEPVNEESAPGSPSYYKTYFLRRFDPSGEGFEALCRGCHRVL